MQAYSPLVRGNEARKGKGIKNAVVLRIADKVRVFGGNSGVLLTTGVTVLARQESRTGSNSLVPAERPCATSQGYFGSPN